MFAWIGSVALNHHFPGQPMNDVDVIADFETGVSFLQENGYNVIYPINNGKTLVGKGDGAIAEVSIAWPGTTNEMLLKHMGDRNVASVDELYLLKMSHRYLRNSPHFYKTMKDIKFLRSKGATIPDELYELFIKREHETYDYAHPSLAQNKKNFFSDDGIKYKYDHDSLHEAVAILGKKPMYTRYQKDGAEVACDYSKWDKLEHSHKLMAVAEEAAVLALERSLIPYPGKLGNLEAFKLALMKICTSITSGWFRNFAWENHDEVLDMVIVHEYDYFGLFQEGLKKGIVRASNL